MFSHIVTYKLPSWAIFHCVGPSCGVQILLEEVFQCDKVGHHIKSNVLCTVNYLCLCVAFVVMGLNLISSGLQL